MPGCAVLNPTSSHKAVVSTNPLLPRCCLPPLTCTTRGVAPAAAAACWLSVLPASRASRVAVASTARLSRGPTSCRTRSRRGQQPKGQCSWQKGDLSHVTQRHVMACCLAVARPAFEGHLAAGQGTNTPRSQAGLQEHPKLYLGCFCCTQIPSESRPV